MTDVGFADDPNLPIIGLVATALGDLCESVVFVGGCATGLLLTAQRADRPYPGTCRAIRPASREHPFYCSACVCLHKLRGDGLLAELGCPPKSRPPGF